MRQIFLFITLLVSLLTFSQNAVAELKFEEAETAFNNGNYELTIQKADEFEEALGGMTDKSLYLRIVSQNKLFDPSIFYIDKKQVALYTSMLDNAARYIKATENNGLNDKFKEVYSINEKLKKLGLPRDETAWEKEKLRIEKEEQDKQIARLAQIENCNKIFEEFTIDDLPFGITIDEFQKLYPNVLGENPKKIVNASWGLYYPKNNVSFDKKYGTVMDKFEETGQNVVIITDNRNGGKICNYEKMIFFYSGREDKLSQYNSKKSELLEKYKYLSDCAVPYHTERVFSVTSNNKTIEVASIQESNIYKIYVSVSKKL
ncbi:hypothetical protein [Flavobacterium mesophilum]|uniref:hypothetical protein n=1 Tax=Flavobacterium mesophilum TaxID=3143495 RepID=UPI0031E0C0FD